MSYVSDSAESDIPWPAMPTINRYEDDMGGEPFFLFFRVHGHIVSTNTLQPREKPLELCNSKGFGWSG